MRIFWAPYSLSGMGTSTLLSAGYSACQPLKIKTNMVMRLHVKETCGIDQKRLII